MRDRKTIQAVFIRVCRDSGFRLDAVRAAGIAALALDSHPLEVWMAMPSLDVMNEIAAGTHPAAHSSLIYHDYLPRVSPALDKISGVTFKAEINGGGSTA